METMTQYVVRRCAEVKRYRKVAEENEVGYDWLCKLAQGLIAEPGSEKIERLFHYYQGLEKPPVKRKPLHGWRQA